MYTHILLATDGSALADKAVEVGLKLAKAHRCLTTAITAVTSLRLRGKTETSPSALLRARPARATGRSRT